MFFGTASASTSQNKTNNTPSIDNTINNGILNKPTNLFHFGILSEPTPNLTATSLPNNYIYASNTNNNNYKTTIVTPFSPSLPPPPPHPQYAAPSTTSTMFAVKPNYVNMFQHHQEPALQQSQQQQQEEEAPSLLPKNSNLTTTSNTVTFTKQSAFAPATSTFAKSAFSLHPANTSSNTTATITTTTNSAFSTSAFAASSAFTSNKPTSLPFANQPILPFSPVMQNTTPVLATESNTFKPSHIEVNNQEQEQEHEEEEMPTAKVELRNKEHESEQEKHYLEESPIHTAPTSTKFAPLDTSKESVFKPQQTNAASHSKFNVQELTTQNNKHALMEPSLSSTSTLSSITNKNTALNPFASQWQQQQQQQQHFSPKQTFWPLQKSVLPSVTSSEQHLRPAQTTEKQFTPYVPSKQTLPSSTSMLREQKAVTTKATAMLPAQDSEMCLLSRVFASFVETMFNLASNTSDAKTSTMLCASLRRQVELALFGVAGQVGLYADYSHTINELLSIWERAKQNKHRFSSSPLPSSSPYTNNNNNTDVSKSSNKFRGELWVLIFALGSQINFIIHTLEERLQNECYKTNTLCKNNEFVNNNAATTKESTNAQQSNNVSNNEKTTTTTVGTLNKHITKSLQVLKKSIIASAEEALNDACEYANQLGLLLLELYQRDSDDYNISNNTSNKGNADGTEAGHYILLPLLLQRTRLTFEAASALGMPNPRSSSNMRSITSKLFSLLNKRIKQHVVSVVPITNTLTSSSVSNNNNIITTTSNSNNNNNNNIDYTYQSPSSPSTSSFAVNNNTNTEFNDSNHNNNNSSNGNQNNNNNSASGKKWKLSWRHEGHRQLTIAFANLIAEMMMADAPTNEEVELFIAAFHDALPEARAERCKLYECQANLLFMQPLTMHVVQQASELFASALVTSESEEDSNVIATINKSNQNKINYSSVSSSSSSVIISNEKKATRRLLALKLTCAQLALGKLPCTSFTQQPQNNNNNNINSTNINMSSSAFALSNLAFPFPELDDVMMAIRTANMKLYEIALRNNSVYYVQNGIHNVLSFVRKRVSLLMVVKFYMFKQCDSRLRIPEMVSFYSLHYSSLHEAMTSWLLPLLVEKFINGVLDNDSLVLSEANPFDEYPKEELLRACARYSNVNSN